MEMLRYNEIKLDRQVSKTDALLFKYSMQCLLYPFCILYCLYQLFLPVVICALRYGFSNIFTGMPHEI